MNGYNDKMSVLVRHVLDKVKGLVVDTQRLAVIKEEVFFPTSIVVHTFYYFLIRLEGSTRTSLSANHIRSLIIMDVTSWQNASGRSTKSSLNFLVGEIILPEYSETENQLYSHHCRRCPDSHERTFITSKHQNSGGWEHV